MFKQSLFLDFLLFFHESDLLKVLLISFSPLSVLGNFRLMELLLYFVKLQVVENQRFIILFFQLQNLVVKLFNFCDQFCLFLYVLVRVCIVLLFELANFRLQLFSHLLTFRESFFQVCKFGCGFFSKSELLVESNQGSLQSFNLKLFFLQMIINFFVFFSKNCGVISVTCI